MSLPRQLLVLRRDAGYLRLHVPPLLYAPSLQPELERELLALAGVRQVRCDPRRARLSVFHDPELVRDAQLVRLVHARAAPWLDQMEPASFTAAMDAQRRQSQRRALLGLLGWAMRDPSHPWWARAALAVALAAREA